MRFIKSLVPYFPALLLGAASVLGFAPFGLFPLPILTLALLFVLWRRSETPRGAAWLGFAWGMGFFLTGVSWVYVSMHDVGGMAMPLAAVATLAFCAVLALFPALAGFSFRRLAAADFEAPPENACGVLPPGGRNSWGGPASFLSDAFSSDITPACGHESSLKLCFLAAGLWTLAEWLRGWVFTGFPWLALGYSQAPPSPLAGYAPLVGSYGVGLIAAFLAAALAFHRCRGWIVVVGIALLGLGLREVTWTTPVGEPITVNLLQGNIPQSIKWVPERLPLSIETYTRLAATRKAALTVLPETAIPLMLDDIPRDTLRALTRHGDALLGVAVRTQDGGYTNGAIAVTQGLTLQGYAKTHLVPFGEYAPPGFSWFFRLANIPMSDFTAGRARQKPLDIAGQKVMPNICYEDLFGEEIIRALPEATLLVNLSNTAWFGDSLAQPQHLQISQMRALETGRPMLRATNTGMTAMVSPDGTVTAALPPFVADVLTVEVRGHAGMTPYARWGNGLALLLAICACLPALLRALRGPGHQGGPSG
ncbi:MAG: apolipoprotein N-acyltransferase [Rhodocyclaceae bacterium]|nr:apolipoprotein N-acyltransferase [Rhodocyclaceae bacterium]